MEVKLFFGSSTGNTERCAKIVHAKLKDLIAEIIDMRKASVEDFDFCDGFILGLPTVDEGLLQEDWRRFWDEVEDVDWDGKTVAIFGLGDPVKYGKWFVDGIGIVADKLTSCGAKVVGEWPNEGYLPFESSKGLRNGKFLGLVLDEDNQKEMSEERIDRWCNQIRPSFT
ncbi:MAG: flavodoxin [Armatimonadetes bacterium]|nr:flavodoxin [Armatimonadota bacterium]